MSRRHLRASVQIIYNKFIFTTVAPSRSITGACLLMVHASAVVADGLTSKLRLSEDHASRRVYSGMHFAVINQGVIGFLESKSRNLI